MSRQFCADRHLQFLIWFRTCLHMCRIQAIFGGGYSETTHESVATFDMYDTKTGVWTSGNLSSKRMRLQAVSLTAQDGTEFALFIGGLGKFSQPSSTDRYAMGGLCTTVDIYNGRTGEWTFVSTRATQLATFHDNSLVHR